MDAREVDVRGADPPAQPGGTITDHRSRREFLEYAGLAGLGLLATGPLVGRLVDCTLDGVSDPGIIEHVKGLRLANVRINGQVGNEGISREMEDRKVRADKGRR